MKFTALFALAQSLDIYVVTDGTEKYDSTGRQKWRQTKDWLEYILQYSGVLDHTETSLHLIDSKDRSGSLHYYNCHSMAKCQSKLRRLKLPHYNTYSSLRFLSNLRKVPPNGDLTNSILLFITDGDVGADIEANCLTDPKHSLFEDDTKKCTEFFIELLNAMENFEAIKRFDSLFMLSWRENSTIPDETVKLVKNVLEPKDLLVANLMNPDDRFAVILKMIKLLGAEVKLRRETQNLKMKLHEGVTDH